MNMYACVAPEMNQSCFSNPSGALFADKIRVETVRKNNHLVWSQIRYCEDRHLNILALENINKLIYIDQPKFTILGQKREFP